MENFWYSCAFDSSCDVGSSHRCKTLAHGGSFVVKLSMMWPPHHYQCDGCARFRCFPYDECCQFCYNSWGRDHSHNCRVQQDFANWLHFNDIFRVVWRAWVWFHMHFFAACLRIGCYETYCLSRFKYISSDLALQSF